jgi:hypothetical protein
MSIRKIVLLAAFVALITPALAFAAPQNRGCKLPKSNADALVILSNYYPGY